MGNHPKETRLCLVCGAAFMEWHCKTRRICSRKCAGVHTARRYASARRTVACLKCGNCFDVSPHRSNARFCGRKCQNSWLAIAYAKARGDAQRGRGEGRSYIKRYGRHEHRVVAEQTIGRALLPGEVVHHKDGNKRNNDPANLEVLPNQGEHAKIHFTKDRKCSVVGCGRKHISRGYCGLHLRRWLKTGQTALPRIPKACSVAGCSRKYVAKGLCGLHWRRARKRGQ